MSIYVNQSGTWKQSKVFVNRNGSWNQGDVFVNRSGKWQGVKPPPPMVLVYDTRLGSNTVALPFYEYNDSYVDCVVDWGDGKKDTYTTCGVKFHTYETAGEYTVTISGLLKSFGSSNYNQPIPELTKVISFGETGLISLQKAFAFCVNLTKVPDSLPSKTRITSLNGTFLGCTSFNDPSISNWKTTSSLSSTAQMFRDATNFNQDISGFYTYCVRTAREMFMNVTAFNQDLSRLRMNQCQSFDWMFSGASSFNQDIGGWDVGKVGQSAYAMEAMFKNAKSFNQDLSRWCVSNQKNKPSQFDDGASSWSKPRPIWGTCP